MANSLNEFVEYLKQQAENGCIYVWGAQGQTSITEKWIKSMETSAANANRAIALWKKRKAQGYKSIRAYDCSGLGMYYLQNLTGTYSSDLNSNSMLGKCERISRSELKTGDWMFRVDSSGKAYHIGYVVSDDLQIVEAKGRDDGVVKRGINASGASYWNAYGRPKIFKQEIDCESEKKAEKEWVVSRLLKQTSPMMRGADVSELQCRLKNAGYDCGEIDGIFGSKTRNGVKGFQRRENLAVDGIAGEKTVTALGGVWKK